MKDKSRLLSSVIVSLMAGFIYYQFGDNLQEKFQSFRAVLSSNDMELYMPQECESFNSLVAKSDSKSKTKKSKFYIKKNYKNTIEFKNKNVSVPGEELVADFIANNQARFDRPQPSKKIDFTAELENLAKNDFLKESQSNNLESKLSTGPRKPGEEIADMKATRPNGIIVIKSFDKRKGSEKVVQNIGYGFEYNYVTEGNLSQIKSNSGNSKTELKKEITVNKSDCENKCTKTDTETRTRVINGKKVKIVAPEIENNIDDRGDEIDSPEMNMHDEDSENETM